MGKENNDLEDAILMLINEYLDADNDTQVNTWDEHKKAVNEAQEEDIEEIIDLSKLSLVDKLGHIINNTADSLLVGDIAFEDAQETLAFVEVVRQYDYLTKAN